MEQFNYVKHHRGLEDGPGYVFIRAVSEFMVPEDFVKVKAQSHANDGNVEIELTIAGVQVSFVKLVENIWNSFKKISDEEVREAAVKMIQGSKLASLLQALDYAEKQIMTEIDKLGFDHG